MIECKACHSTKPEDAFHREAKSKTGYKSVCKACRKTETTQYNQRNRAAIVAKSREWRRTHREQHRAYSRHYSATHCAERRARYKENPAPKRESDRRYLTKHREKVRARKRAYGQSHREQMSHAARLARLGEAYRETRRLYSRRYYLQNVAQMREKGRRYYETHPEVIRGILRRRRARQGNVKFSVAALDDVHTRHGGRCGICDDMVERSAVSWDHVEPLVAGGRHVIENIQPTHIACNRLKSRRSLEWAREHVPAMLMEAAAHHALPNAPATTFPTFVAALVTADATATGFK